MTTMTGPTIQMNKSSPVQIPDRLFFKIGDVAEIAGVKPYVLRYWETEFPMIAPEKSGSGQRVYRRTDVDTVLAIKHLLYQERYSIEGARKRIRELKKAGVSAASVVEAISAFDKDSDADMESIQAVKPQSGAKGVSVKRAHGLVKDLKKLSQTPINKLFSL
jgi:DNA-binding transcriptional MerR regulator